MKKLLASMLAVAMVSSLSATAFAVDTASIRVDTGSRLFKTDSDGVMHEITGDVSVKPGQTLYVEVLPENDGETISSKTAGQYKVVVDFKVGKDMFDGASIESKKILTETGKQNASGEIPHGLAASYQTKAELDAAIAALMMHDNTVHADATGCVDNTHYTVAATPAEKDAALAKFKAETKSEYRYFAGIKTKSSYTTKANDFMGSVKVVKKSTSNSADASAKEINSVVKYEAANVVGDSHEVTKETPVVSFDDVDGDVELLFGSRLSFTVNGRNQDDLYLGFSEKPNTKVLDQNPEANIDFISFTSKPTFNRIGELRFFAEEDSYIYEVTNNGLKKVKAKYDEDYEAYVFDTRSLGEYAISDMELEYVADADDETVTPDEKPENGGNSDNSGNGGTTTDKPHNPNTGSNDMVNVAVAVAVVSLAAAGAVALKKASK